jgi:hypothetical protein
MKRIIDDHCLYILTFKCSAVQQTAQCQDVHSRRDSSSNDLRCLRLEAQSSGNSERRWRNLKEGHRGTPDDSRDQDSIRIVPGYEAWQVTGRLSAELVCTSESAFNFGKAYILWLWFLVESSITHLFDIVQTPDSMFAEWSNTSAVDKLLVKQVCIPLGRQDSETHRDTMRSHLSRWTLSERNHEKPVPGIDHSLPRPQHEPQALIAGHDKTMGFPCAVASHAPTLKLLW